MAAPRLASYIQQQMQAGYDINTIRDFLIRSGYDKREIDEAVDYVYGAKPQGLSPLLIFTGIAVIIAAGLGLFFLLGGDEETEAPRQLLDLETSSLIDTAEPGDYVSFNIQLVNMGQARRYDVSLTHDLEDSAGDVIDTKQETIAVETRAAKTSQFTIPQDLDPGIYTLRTTASYDGQQALSSFTIRARTTVPEQEPEETVPSQRCPVSCDDFNECTRDFCGVQTNYECINEPITPCCGNNKCESGENPSICPSDCQEVIVPQEPDQETVPGTIDEVIDRAEELAASDPGRAASYCEQQSRENYKDSCYSTVAETTEDSSYCDQIGSTTKRDSCYTDAALRDDFTVCEKIENRYLRQSCQALAEVS